ncbi:hypothetical protein A2U01_0081118, partial [Trifolium medium]|nr:hypothetical protein [Trifolium medium]
MNDVAQDVVTSATAAKSPKKDVEENVLTSGPNKNITTEVQSTEEDPEKISREEGQNSEPKNQEEEGPEDER